MTCWLLMLIFVISDVTAYVELIGAGATAPASVYVAWMAAYRSLRRRFVDVRLVYHARGSGFGKQAIASGSVTYAGSDALLSEADYEKKPELQMFPSIALLVSCFLSFGGGTLFRYVTNHPGRLSLLPSVGR